MVTALPLAIMPVLFFQETLFSCFLQAGRDAFFVYGSQTLCRNSQGNIFVFLRDKEFLGLKIGIESSFCLDIGMGNLVPYDHCLSGYFTNS